MPFEYRKPAEHGKANVSEVSDDYASKLLAGFTRDVPGALDRMRANPFGQLRCEGGVLCWCPMPAERAQ